jgi:hypothetical protein
MPLVSAESSGHEARRSGLLSAYRPSIELPISLPRVAPEAAFGVSSRFDPDRCRTHLTLFEIATAAAAAVLGEDNVQRNMPSTMGCNIPRALLRKKPGAIWIGNGKSASP